MQVVSIDIPLVFDERFLSWFRKRTEASWVDDVRARRWLPGLSDEEIDTVERRWQARFPPDYRLFLSRLHAIGEAAPGAGPSRKRLAPVPHSKVVYNWLLDTKPLKHAFAWPLSGLLPHKQYKGIWRSAWGREPPEGEVRERQIREQAVGAAPLIPLTGHRYLVGAPCQAGNPVLSVYGGDIIPYGKDLRGFLLIEFAGTLGLNYDRAYWKYGIPDHDILRRIPFWGDFFV